MVCVHPPFVLLNHSKLISWNRLWQIIKKKLIILMCCYDISLLHLRRKRRWWRWDGDGNMMEYVLTVWLCEGLRCYVVALLCDGFVTYWLGSVIALLRDGFVTWWFCYVMALLCSEVVTCGEMSDILFTCNPSTGWLAASGSTTPRGASGWTATMVSCQSFPLHHLECIINWIQIIPSNTLVGCVISYNL